MNLSRDPIEDHNASIYAEISPVIGTGQQLSTFQPGLQPGYEPGYGNDLQQSGYGPVENNLMDLNGEVSTGYEDTGPYATSNITMQNLTSQVIMLDKYCFLNLMIELKGMYLNHDLSYRKCVDGLLTQYQYINELMLFYNFLFSVSFKFLTY